MSCKSMDRHDCPKCGPQTLHNRGFCTGCGRSRFYVGPAKSSFNNKPVKAKLRGVDRL